jgi:LDH2 family malate/lactate/ureidoglycolate dehydrogenase
VAEFAAIVDRTIDAIVSLPAAGEGRVLVPGQRRAATAEQRSRDGVPRPPRVWESVVEAAAGYGIAAPEPVSG